MLCSNSEALTRVRRRTDRVGCPDAAPRQATDATTPDRGEVG